MNRQEESRRRRLRAFLTMTLLFLLQIFNEVDWDCAAGFHPWNSDPCSRAEHRMETTNLPDMDRLLKTAWQENWIGIVPFSLFPEQEKYGFFLDFPGLVLRLLNDRSSGPPPEELIPWRC